jgi:hypothetical protein
MDEETRAYLDRMMTEINDGFERILDRLSHIRADTDDTRGRPLNTLEAKMAKLSADIAESTERILREIRASGR